MNKRTNYRWVVCGLLFAATLINYLDREILGLLKPTLAEKFHWTNTDYSTILNFFQAAYAIGQTAFGPILAWIGTKAAFCISIVIWSCAAIGTAGSNYAPGVTFTVPAFISVPWSYLFGTMKAVTVNLAGSVVGFSAARFVLGIGEGGNFPGCIRGVTEWFPQKERSIATGWFNTGASIGKVVAALLVPVLYALFNWQGSFVILGVLGFIWLIVWIIFFSTPERSKFVNAEELALIQTEEPDAVGDKPIDRDQKAPWLKMMSFRQTWAYFATCILVGPVWWFYGFWLPDLYSTMFGLDIRNFGPPLAFVAVGSMLGSIGGGMLSPYLMRRGFSLNAGRKIAALVCAIAALPIWLVPMIRDYGVVIDAAGVHHAALWAVWSSAAIFALANAAHQGWSATMYTAVSDLFPKNGVATVVGLGGAIAAIASIEFARFVGQWLDKYHKYDLILYILGSAYVLALLIFHLIVPRIRRVSIE